MISWPSICIYPNIDLSNTTQINESNSIPVDINSSHDVVDVANFLDKLFHICIFGQSALLTFNIDSLNVSSHDTVNDPITQSCQNEVVNKISSNGSYLTVE